MHRVPGKKSDRWIVALAALLLAGLCSCTESPVRETVDFQPTNDALEADDYQRADYRLVPESLLPNHSGQDAYTPAVAYGNGTFLASWQSGRVATGDLCSSSPDFIGSIVAARLDKAGKVLDQQPIVISDAADLQERPSVAYGGGVFVVVWQDLRNGKDWDVYATRVSSDGQVLDKNGILLAGRARSQGAPKVVWDGKTFVVVWMDNYSGQYQVFATRLTAAGSVLDPKGFKVSTRDAASDKRGSIFPTIASSGDGKSFVLWIVSSIGHGGRHSWADGALVSDGKSKIVFEYTLTQWNALGRDLGPGKDSSPLGLAASAKGYLLAWSNRNKAIEKSNCSFFGTDGKRGTDRRTLSSQPQLILTPALAWDGTSFVAAWGTQQPEKDKSVHDRVQASRLGADGKPSGTVHAIAGSLASPAKHAAVASDGVGTTCVVYEKHPVDAKTPIAIGIRLFGPGDK